MFPNRFRFVRPRFAAWMGNPSLIRTISTGSAARGTDFGWIAQRLRWQPEWAGLSPGGRRRESNYIGNRLKSLQETCDWRGLINLFKSWIMLGIVRSICPG